MTPTTESIAPPATRLRPIITEASRGGRLAKNHSQYIAKNEIPQDPLGFAVVTTWRLMRNYYWFLIEPGQGLDQARTLAWLILHEDAATTRTEITRHANRRLHAEARALGWKKPRGFKGYVSEDVALNQIGYRPINPRPPRPKTEVESGLFAGEAARLLAFFMERGRTLHDAAVDTAIVSLAVLGYDTDEIAVKLELPLEQVQQRRREIARLKIAAERGKNDP